MTDGSARVSYPSFLPNPTGYRERPCPRLMQTWAWLAKCHTEVYLASVFVAHVARTGNDENLRHRYSTCSECFPLNVPAHRNESGYLRTSSKTVSIATLHQPSSPYLRPPSPGGEGTRSGGLRGAGLRLPSPGGRRCRAAADEGGAGPRPVPPLTRPSARPRKRGSPRSRRQRFFGVGLFDTNGSSSRFETRRAKGRAGRCSRLAAWLASSHSAL